MTTPLTWSDSQSGHTLIIVSYNCRDSFGVSAISPGKPFCLSCVKEGTGETLYLLPHIIVFYDLLQYRPTAASILIVLYDRESQTFIDGDIICASVLPIGKN